jgi:hypothetical protein
MKDDRIEQLERAMRTMQANFETVSKVMLNHPTLDEVEAALERKKKPEQSPDRTRTNPV